MNLKINTSPWFSKTRSNTPQALCTHLVLRHVTTTSECQLTHPLDHTRCSQLRTSLAVVLMQQTSRLPLLFALRDSIVNSCSSVKDLRMTTQSWSDCQVAEVTNNIKCIYCLNFIRCYSQISIKLFIMRTNKCILIMPTQLKLCCCTEVEMCKINW